MPIVSGIDSTVIYPEMSVMPPPFVATDNDAVLSSAGYSCIASPLTMRSITPKPWPWVEFPVPNVTITSLYYHHAGFYHYHAYNGRGGADLLRRLWYNLHVALQLAL